MPLQSNPRAADTFAGLVRSTPALDGPARLALFGTLPAQTQTAMWRQLLGAIERREHSARKQVVT